MENFYINERVEIQSNIFSFILLVSKTIEFKNPLDTYTKWSVNCGINQGNDPFISQKVCDSAEFLSESILKMSKEVYHLM